eukprot:3174018-Alexandrium_andersonii.AAC.1
MAGAAAEACPAAAKEAYPVAPPRAPAPSGDPAGIKAMPAWSSTVSTSTRGPRGTGSAATRRCCGSQEPA